MHDCLLCQIGRKEHPARFVYEDDHVFACEDIHPQAPTHILICPRKHLTSLDEAGEEDAMLLGHMLVVAGRLARERKITGGYRTVLNTGRGAAQSIPHLHLHLLGGRAFRWPPG
jgi:histidine triad (HIT) family protein